MQQSTTSRGTSLSAVLIAPDRTLALEFAAACSAGGGFQILLELKSYPSEQTLDIRIRQLQPDVVLVDVVSDLETAASVISSISASSPNVSVVAIDRRSESDTILRALRAGASEYLYAPFDASHTSEAVARLLRLRRPEPAIEHVSGTVCVFSSVKPGAGASTLATQCSFALRRSAGKRVLLVDFDLMGGTIGSYLKLDHSFSVLDALDKAQTLSGSAWTSQISSSCGVDILPSPLVPCADNIEMDRIQNVIAFARTMYDWVVCDLPVIFQRTSMMMVPQADRTFLVSTSELPSLSLARRSVMMLEQLGFPKSRFDIVVNRIHKRDNFTRQDMEKLFNCPVHANFPNDYFSLHRVVTLGQPLLADCDLGRSVESLARQMAGVLPNGKKAAGDSRRD